MNKKIIVYLFIAYILLFYTDDIFQVLFVLSLVLIVEGLSEYFRPAKGTTEKPKRKSRKKKNAKPQYKKVPTESYQQYSPLKESYLESDWAIKLCKWADEHNIPDFSIPRDERELKKLTLLPLNYCIISELPDEIVHLRNLTSLNLSHNNFVEVPNVILKLTNLTAIYLAHNKIKEVPIKLAKLSNLHTLTLNNNQLKTIPIEVASLPQLTNFDMTNNPIMELASVTEARVKEREEIMRHDIKTVDMKILNYVYKCRELGIEPVDVEDLPYEKFSEKHKNPDYQDDPLDKPTLLRRREYFKNESNKNNQNNILREHGLV